MAKLGYHPISKLMIFCSITSCIGTLVVTAIGFASSEAGFELTVTNIFVSIVRLVVQISYALSFLGFAVVIEFLRTLIAEIEDRNHDVT
jgi:hypothetical protein